MLLSFQRGSDVLHVLIDIDAQAKHSMCTCLPPVLMGLSCGFWLISVLQRCRCVGLGAVTTLHCMPA